MKGTFTIHWETRTGLAAGILVSDLEAVLTDNCTAYSIETKIEENGTEGNQNEIIGRRRTDTSEQ